MSSEPLDAPPNHEFACPVCRARQLPSPKCRRCQADLALVIKARQRLWYLRSLPNSPEVQSEIAELVGNRDPGGN